MVWLLSVTIGVGTGVASSFLVWWMLTRHFRPRLEWCPNLARFPGNDSILCQSRVRNIGRRAAVDVHVIGRIRAAGLVRSGVAEWFTVYDIRIPVLEGKNTRRFSASSSTVPDAEVRDRRMRQYGGDVAQDHRDGLAISIDRMLDAAPEGGLLEMTVIASDEYSGSRHVARRSYTLEDVEDGRFVECGCEILPASAPVDDEDNT